MLFGTGCISIAGPVFEDQCLQGHCLQGQHLQGQRLQGKRLQGQRLQGQCLQAPTHLTDVVLFIGRKMLLINQSSIFNGKLEEKIKCKYNMVTV